VYVAAFIVLARAGQFRDTYPVGVSVVVLLLLPVAVWGLRGSSYLASAWVLVMGCVLVDLLIVTWGGVQVVACLLVLPVGLAVVFISVAGGALTAMICTTVLLLVSNWLALDSTTLFITVLGMWGVLGLIWLTRRPFSTAMEWYYFSYKRNHDLLERARDVQLQLRQTLEDLGEANRQLTRLNDVAQGLRRAAEESRRAKEEFVANVSHELRTPLNMILGFSEMIARSPDIYGSEIPSSLLADLDVIHRNSQHLSSLIDDVLDLSQVDADQIALTREWTPFQEIVDAALVAVRPLFDSKGLYLREEIPEDLVVFCDQTRIRQVLLNLLSNAGRFTEQGGVHLRAWQEEGTLIVSVTDTGPGIAAQDLGRLFQPFQQIDGSIRRRYGGTGLGLCISKRFIELHEGRIWVESEENVGTTFSFQIPVAPPSPENEAHYAHSLAPGWEYVQRTRPSKAPEPVISSRLVVLESGKVLRRLLSRYTDGIEIAPVASLQQAIHALGSEPARALLINDVSIGDALRRLDEHVELPYGTPAIVCSVPGIHEAAGGLGVSDYLVKPISRETLLATLDRLGLKGKTVLIVDDQLEALQLFRRMLISEGCGYRILRATNGQQGMRILREQGADAVLLDLVMPRMDGFRFLAEKSQDPAVRDIPVVVISACDPAGQPVVSNALAVTRRGGLSVPQLLSCIDTLSTTLAAAGPTDGPVWQEALSDSPALE
jgi:signal transduction histidine kinase/CheY-like chemotaxis protein